MTLDYDRFLIKIFDLKNTWELLVSKYLKHFANEPNFDKADDLKERMSVSSVESDSSSNNYDNYYTQEPPEIPVEPDTANDSEEENMHEDDTEVIERPKPFTFADFKRSEKEKENIKPKNTNAIKCDEKAEDSVKDNVKNKNRTNSDNVRVNKKKLSSASSVDSTLNARKVNITICDGPSCEANNVVEPLIPPQPVPPEIEQQRAMSISKDTEVQKACYQNTLMAYIELVLAFPLERFLLINPVLQSGFVQLAKNVTDPPVYERINLYFDKQDLSDVANR